MAKKRFQVIKATTREIPGVMVGGRVKKFKRNGTFETDDPGEAKEIDKVLGEKGTGEVVVTEDIVKETGHTYTFGASKKFADAWDEFEKRRKRKEKQHANSRKPIHRTRTHERADHRDDSRDGSSGV
jgi:hypothetical protein